MTPFGVSLAGAMQGDALVRDTRFSTRAARAKNRQVLNTLVGAWTAQYTKAELTQKLGGLIPYGPLQTVQDMIKDPHVAARNMLSTIANPDNPDRPWRVASNPLRFGAAPLPTPASPPKLGADNDRYLTPAPPPIHVRSRQKSPPRGLWQLCHGDHSGGHTSSGRNAAGLYRKFIHLSFTGSASGVDLYCKNSAKL